MKALSFTMELGRTTIVVVSALGVGGASAM